jgi:hypothetical protein
MPGQLQQHGTASDDEAHAQPSNAGACARWRRELPRARPTVRPTVGVRQQQSAMDAVSHGQLARVSPTGSSAP